LCVSACVCACVCADLCVCVCVCVCLTSPLHSALPPPQESEPHSDARGVRAHDTGLPRRPQKGCGRRTAYVFVSVCVVCVCVYVGVCRVMCVSRVRVCRPCVCRVSNVCVVCVCPMCARVVCVCRVSNVCVSCVCRVVHPEVCASHTLTHDTTLHLMSQRATARCRGVWRASRRR